MSGRRGGKGWKIFVVSMVNPPAMRNTHRGEHKEPSPRPRQISHMLVAKVSTFHQKMLKVRYPNSETFIKQESLQYIPKE